MQHIVCVIINKLDYEIYIFSVFPNLFEKDLLEDL